MSNVERLLLSAVEDPPDVDPQDLLVELNHQQISISGRLVARSGELRDGARAQSLALAEMDGSVSMLQEALAGMTVQASSAQEQASRARDAARSGRESVLENLRMMESMGASSKQIENLAKLLQSVAKQTRLLALNASIEAARVGEEGRGFAVIADEIRSLSDAAKDAVTEVSNLVKRTETWIDGGVELSRMVEADLAEISEAATDTASEVATIVSSAERQVDVADRTYRAVHEVVELVNSNLVVAEEIGDAGSLLQEKTEKIMSVAAEYYDV